MEYAEIKRELETSPTLRLLRKGNAALILSFLHRQFKQVQRVSLSQIDLESRLSDYLEYLQDLEPNTYLQKPKDYLNEWCDDRLLRKTFDSNSDEPVFTLTPETEKAIAWLEDLQQKDEFVGTESRFLQIFALLKETQERSTTDIEVRITQLENERDRLQQEIDQIRETGTVERYTQTQLQERFLFANQVARQLIADFKDVEQNFRKLARTVQEAQLQQDTRKGAVISRVLDADQELKDSPQGRSFYAFWNFLMSTDKRQELKSMIQNVYQLDELKPLTQENLLLFRIERSLLDAGEYVVQSNHRLTEKLRQMLDERNMRENRRVAELINDVQRLALQVIKHEPRQIDFWVLEGEPMTHLVMTRPLHSLEESEIPTFSLDLTNLEDIALDEEITELCQQFYLDEDILAQRIAQTLEHSSTISLTDLIQLYPVTQGLPEIVAYVAIAAQSEQHSINLSTIELLTIDSLEDEKPISLTVPQIIFRR
ncbi:DUF3375 domain-containing protein [Pseudanabaena mucicola]|uniref:DUF3375 domain-containing protein n=1 Tax=Pseudanabaena mucicola FACHB-723 TaxID=2692860 RepID=A0ABR8A030_9CYAN|nr:DUF3375 domain-containing protein [Pseudanabaena mucicola]MBD2189105.1 DUF3375 domain-containing protein [Pseudanabaena mucicola FACHB-723]